MYAEVAMVRRTIEAKIDTKRDRRPGWVFRATIETNLPRIKIS